MRSALSRRATSLIVLIVVLAGAALAYASDGYTANQATPVSITGPDGVCKKVTNNSGTGLSEYIPTATVAEWQSFYTNPPAGVTLSSCVTPGSQTFTASGSFTVPDYNTMTVKLWGGGGGGVGSNDGSSSAAPVPIAGNSGGASTWDGGAAYGNPQANGGTRGTATNTNGAGGGAGGTGQNCATAATGQWGGNTTAITTVGGNPPPSGKGGDGANGGAGGASVAADFSNGLPGSAPGGGGSGSSNRRYARGQDPRWGYAGGGGGGYCAITYSAGDYAPGSVITVTVGSGGSGGNGTRDGGAGARGQVTITWN